MSITFREYVELKTSSIIAFSGLVTFFELVFFGFGSYISILVSAIYLVFNLRWLYSSYSIFANETKLNTLTPKKVVLVNFIPLICFYKPFYSVIELLNYSNKKPIFGYVNWTAQLISIPYIIFEAFGDQNFDFLYITSFIWASFSLYLYQGVNTKIQKLVC